MTKWIISGRTAQELLGMGALIAAKAVSPTLGPVGRTVLMDRRRVGPSLVSDGFTINRELELADPFMDMAVRILEDASEQVREECGDGTTSTVILSEAILRMAQPSVAMGADPMAMARGIRCGEAVAAAALQRAAMPVASPDELVAVAALACKDQELGRAIADLVDQTGIDGAVVAQESNSREIVSKLVEGFEFDSGVLSPQFLTDRSRMEAVLEEPYLLLTGQKLQFVEDILPALERILPTAHRLVIVAQDVEGEALTGLAMNAERGNLEVIAVKGPGIGGRQEERLEDLAAATSATVLPDDQTGRTLAGITLEDLGRAERVVADRFRTTIFGAQGDDERMQRRIAIIQDQLDESQTDQYGRQLLERIGAIQGLTGYLNVGGLTEAEMKEKLPRVRNAVVAAQAAHRSGIQPGGGAAYVRAALELDPTELDGDERLGMQILQTALSFPLRQLAHNAGEEGAVILSRLTDSPVDHAYDATNLRIGPAAEMGILDPASTVEAVLHRACSIASVMLSVDTVIVDPPGPFMEYERPDMSAKFD